MGSCQNVVTSGRLASSFSYACRLSLNSKQVQVRLRWRACWTTSTRSKADHSSSWSRRMRNLACKMTAVKYLMEASRTRGTRKSKAVVQAMALKVKTQMSQAMSLRNESENTGWTFICHKTTTISLLWPMASSQISITFLNLSLTSYKSALSWMWHSDRVQFHCFHIQFSKASTRIRVKSVGSAI